MNDLCRAVAPMAAALIVGLSFGAPNSARADVLNTYNGAECVSVSPNAANNLFRNAGISASSITEVVCPIVKAIFDSTGPVTVAVAASGGTQCRLESYDVFNVVNRVIEPPQFRVFPGIGVSGLNFPIPRSLRGAMQMRCILPAGGTILNYLAREHT
jgi:hypothetical protein